MKWLTAVAAVALMAAPAAAAPLNPNDFSSLGLVNGAIALDSSTLAFSGGGNGALISQGGTAPDIAVFTFDGGSVLGDVTVTGSNAVAILFRGSGTVAGTIDVSGAGHLGVAGGRRGGTILDGNGPGAGLGGSTGPNFNGTGPGSGGGFGTPGGSAGAGVTFRVGGPAYGAPLSGALDAGSSGGRGGRRFTNNNSSGGLGGAGGGALEIGALMELIFDEASIFANGGDGGDGNQATGGGGGSGGGLLLHGFDVLIDPLTLITANGGDAGRLGLPQQAGCGGAGRIEILHNTAGGLSNQGTVQAKYGAGNAQICDPTANVFSIVASPDIGMNGGPVSPVPLPAGLPLFGMGLISLALVRRWRKTG